MRRLVAVFVEEVAFLGRCSVCVGYCVLQVVVDMEYSRGVVRVCGGVNDVVAIEYSL